ncbi:Site-specific recombinase XerD [Orenia metallireducens]|uniref:Site-specific recombinase XerD n=1 Tax=Orenia metallireducens TaxID=1413210 RepID=A0A285GTN0_9FIRM|nr:site-specific integrase [Orenia metallireducens]SNY26922.1 Site-specific recombinase XerD [Orenia metallireducens]
MAHLRKKGNGKWQIIVEVGRDPITGKRNRKYKTVEGTKKQAEAVMAKLITKIDTGSYIDPKDMTVADLLNQWLESYCKPNLQPRSYESYKMITQKHLIPLLGRIKLQDLKPIHIQNYQTRKLNRGRQDNKSGGLSPTTVQNHHHILSQAIKYGIRLQLLENNPAEVIKAPPREEPQLQYLDRKGVEKVLEISKGKWIHEYIFVAIHTGMRRGEMLGLTWDKVDLKGRKVSIVQAAQRVRNEGIIFKKPKTKSSKRLITISKGVVEVLKRIKKKQTEKRLKLKNHSYNKYNLVFCEDDGRVCNPYTVTRRWNRIAEKAGYPDIRLHDLRHTHATLLLSSGIHPKVVQERLGHKNITTTLNTYSHVVPTLQREAAERLDNIVSYK